jgi:hypothetical protein
LGGQRVVRQALGARDIVQRKRDQLGIAVLEHRFDIGENGFRTVEEVGRVPAARFNPHVRAPISVSKRAQPSADSTGSATTIEGARMGRRIIGAWTSPKIGYDTRDRTVIAAVRVAFLTHDDC